MAFLGKITAPLKRAVMKAGRKNSADNKVISKAFEDSDYKSRPKFVDDVKSAVIQGDTSKTSKKITKKKKESTVKRTRKEEAELKRLIREQEKDMAAEKKNEVGSTGGKSAGGRQRKTISKPGTTRGKRKVADPRNQLRGGDQFSKAEIANMTYDEVQEFIDKGIGGSALVNANRMKNNVTKGQLDEVAGMVKGGELSIAKKLGGGIDKPEKKKKKKNTQIAYSRKLSKKTPPRPPKSPPVRGKGYGGITPVKKIFRRGGGQALRGFGKATYSNKMY
tara:strand:- start:169 stop:999 length:831 start_codon:yes stop_codon:yes gene_type:complete